MASQPSIPYKDLNDAQKRIRKSIDIATDTCIAYAAKEVPPLGNLTNEGIVEELGYLNEARKELEKAEKILKERLKSRISLGEEIKSDNFTMTYENRSRTALNQTAAKEKLEELGVLADYMTDSEVPTMTIKRN